MYDADEMVNLVDSSLEFWLTSGRFTKEFESEFAKYLGVKYCSLVNSGSSANLLAFMALTSPLLKERQILPGDEENMEDEEHLSNEEFEELGEVDPAFTNVE